MLSQKAPRFTLGLFALERFLSSEKEPTEKLTHRNRFKAKETI
jgi:hypothetical protein